MPRFRLDAIITKIKDGSLSSWDEVHAEYLDIVATLENEKALHAYLSLCSIEQKKTESMLAPLTSERWNSLIQEAIGISRYISDELFATKQKDYASFFRGITYDSKEEMRAVLNQIEEIELIKDRKNADTKRVSLFEKYKM